MALVGPATHGGVPPLLLGGLFLCLAEKELPDQFFEQLQGLIPIRSRRREGNRYRHDLGVRDEMLDERSERRDPVLLFEQIRVVEQRVRGEQRVRRRAIVLQWPEHGINIPSRRRQRSTAAVEMIR